MINTYYNRLAATFILCAAVALGVLPTISSAATDATVVASGETAAAWATASTWESNAIPTNDDTDNTFNITFSPASGKTSSLSFNHTYSIDGTVQNRNVNIISSIENLYLYQAGTGNNTKTDLKLDNVTAGNVYIKYLNDNSTFLGKFTLSRTSTINEKVSVYLNSKLNASNSLINGFYGKLYVNADNTIGRLSGSGSLYIADGVKFTNQNTTRGLNLQSDSIMQIGTDSSYVISLGAKIQNALVKGNLTLNGAQIISTSLDDTFAFRIEKVATFTETSSINSTYADATKARASITGKMYSYAEAGKLSFAQALQLSNGSTLIMNSANAIVNGDGKTKLLVSTLSNTSFDGAADATLKIGENENGNKLSVAKNTVAELALYSNSNLNLFLNGNELEILAIDQQGDTSNNFLLTLGDNIAKGSFLVKDFDSLTTVESVKDHIILGSEISESSIFVEFVNGTNATDGYSIYTQIPEPAEWAAFFGVFAISIALYRRRK